MIEYKYLSNLKRLTLGYGTLNELDKRDILSSILQKYKEAGFKTEGKHVKLYLIVSDEWFDYDESLLLSNDEITILLSDVVPPRGAAYYDEYCGIYYFFHTDERRHKYNPHIHAKYQSQEISIYLKDYRVVGKFNNASKQNQAIKYVKRNRQAILKEWNRITGQEE